MDERLWEGSPRKVHTLLFGPISFVFQQLKLSVFGGLSSNSRSSLSCNRLNLVKVLWPHLLTDVLTPLSVSADTVDLSDLFWTKADFYLNSHLQLSDRRHSVALSTVLSVVPYLALSTVLSVSSSSRPFFPLIVVDFTFQRQNLEPVNIFTTCSCFSLFIVVIHSCWSGWCLPSTTSGVFLLPNCWLCPMFVKWLWLIALLLSALSAPHMGLRWHTIRCSHW